VLGRRPASVVGVGSGIIYDLERRQPLVFERCKTESTRCPGRPEEALFHREVFKDLGDSVAARIRGNNCVRWRYVVLMLSGLCFALVLY